MKEAVVAAAFMFEFNIIQIFGPRNDILFCPLFVLQSGISDVICDLELQLFKGGMKISFRQYGAFLSSIYSSRRAQSHSTFNWKPVYFPEM